MLLSRHRASIKNGVLAIGNFDGVHLGHQQLINATKRKAQELQTGSQIMIFEPQPREFFLGKDAPTRLTNLREKYQLIKSYGIDELICQNFNYNFRSLSATDFIEKILIEKLGIKHLIIGEDFKFGCDRKGDYAFLQMAARKYGFGIDAAQDFLYDNIRISSTWVRNSLAKKDLKTAAILLGRNFYLTGKVVEGKKIGRSFDVPTANINLDFNPPVTGVFVTKVTLENGNTYKGAASVGVNPSIEVLPKPVLEVHLLNFSGNLYGQRIKVEFIEFLRPEKKFDNLDALKSQIHSDLNRVAGLTN